MTLMYVKFSTDHKDLTYINDDIDFTDTSLTVDGLYQWTRV